MTKNRLCGILGLARKAGKITVGSESVIEGIRRGKALLVLVACDASDNTKKMFADSCRYYGTELKVLALDSDELSSAIGKKSKTVALYISDGNFVNAVHKIIDDDGGCVYGSTEQK